MMNKKEILIGFIVGIIANALGTILALAFFSFSSGLSIPETFEASMQQGRIGSILALGAILNLIVFFLFLKIKRDQRARGVVFATLATAMVILYFQIF